MSNINQLDKFLKIFEDEIRLLISREESPREFRLLKNIEKGKLTNLFYEMGIENFSIIYNRQIIEAYYNPFNLINNYIQAPNITNDILEKIFIYLAHHEYGHSLFCKSTLNYAKFREKNNDIIFENFGGRIRNNLCFLFWILFVVLKESFADFQVKKSNVNIPKYFFDINFKPFEQFLRINKVTTIIDLGTLIDGFYSSVLYSSSWFFIFDQWDYLLEKCGENDKMESINLIFMINKMLETLIKKELDLEGYKNYLIQLTLLLREIDYSMLIYENNINRNIIERLDCLLASI